MVKSNVDKPKTEQRSDAASLFRGVRKRKWGKYVSEIRLPNSRQRIWLGSYDSAEKAARAFDAAMFCLRGSGGNFNFPDNPPDIPGGRSMTPSEIQAAAARFANSGLENENSGRPENEKSESESSEEGTAVLLPMESPSPALSDATVQTDFDTNNNGLFPESFDVNGSGLYQPDFSNFSGFNDFVGDFYSLPQDLPSYDYGEENLDGLIINDSFLWNF